MKKPKDWEREILTILVGRKDFRTFSEALALARRCEALGGKPNIRLAVEILERVLALKDADSVWIRVAHDERYSVAAAEELLLRLKRRK